MCLGVQAAQRNQVTLTYRRARFHVLQELISLYPCLGVQYVRAQTCIFFPNQFLFYFSPNSFFFLLLCFSVCLCFIFFYMGFKPLLVFARIYMLPIDIMTAELSKQGKQDVSRATTMATIEKPDNSLDRFWTEICRTRWTLFLFIQWLKAFTFTGNVYIYWKS